MQPPPTICARSSRRADRLRVEKSASTSAAHYIFSGNKVIAEYANGSLNKEYIYFGDRLLATHAGANLTYHLRDHVSVRLNTDASGSILGHQSHYPYGEVWYNTGTTHEWKFTTYERDSESGNDYAIQRYHAARLGRFSAADPVQANVEAGPQGLNRYAYVAGDPVNRVDPDGSFLDDFFPPPFGFCSPFPFNVGFFVDGFDLPRPFLRRNRFLSFFRDPFGIIEIVTCICVRQEGALPRFGTCVWVPEILSR